MLCCEKKKKKSLALCTWTVAQELIDLFEKTATAKNKEDFCCLYTEIYYSMIEIIRSKNLTLYPLKIRNFCIIRDGSIQSLHYFYLGIFFHFRS